MITIVSGTIADLERKREFRTREELRREVDRRGGEFIENKRYSGGKEYITWRDVNTGEVFASGEGDAPMQIITGGQTGYRITDKAPRFESLGRPRTTQIERVEEAERRKTFGERASEAGERFSKAFATTAAVGLAGKKSAVIGKTISSISPVAAGGYVGALGVGMLERSGARKKLEKFGSDIAKDPFMQKALRPAAAFYTLAAGPFVEAVSGIGKPLAKEWADRPELPAADILGGYSGYKWSQKVSSKAFMSKFTDRSFLKKKFLTAGDKRILLKGTGLRPLPYGKKLPKPGIPIGTTGKFGVPKSYKGTLLGSSAFPTTKVITKTKVSPKTLWPHQRFRTRSMPWNEPATAFLGLKVSGKLSTITASKKKMLGKITQKTDLSKVFASKTGSAVKLKHKEGVRTRQKYKFATPAPLKLAQEEKVLREPKPFRGPSKTAITPRIPPVFLEGPLFGTSVKKTKKKKKKKGTKRRGYAPSIGGILSGKFTDKVPKVFTGLETRKRRRRKK